MDVVTYSRNVFIPVTNLCRNKCKYCGFRGSLTDYYLINKNQVNNILNMAKNKASEALFTFGERPDVFNMFKKQLKVMGYKSFIDYVVDLCNMAIQKGLLPHTNPGVVERRDLKKLREYNASMGLMLETTANLEAHEGCEGKIPEKRIEMIRTAGRLEIPFTTGLLIGIGESWDDRIDSLEVIRDLHENYGHIQEVIIQNFKPKPGTAFSDKESPSIEEMVKVVKMARNILPSEVTVQIPPNLSDFSHLIKAGARDLGGISQITSDFINPEAPWPSIEFIRQTLKDSSFILKERLPIYPRYVVEGWYPDNLSSLIEKMSDKGGYRKCLI